MGIPYSKLNGYIQKIKRADNKSGVTGVSFNTENNAWSSRLNYQRKIYWGGLHKKKEKAIRSRLKLEFEVLGIDKMPQKKLIPIHFKNPKNKLLIAYNNSKNNA